jgi:hypothetical protein
MTDTAQLTYSETAENTIDIFTTSLNIRWAFPNKMVERQPNKIGITVDPNMGFRVVECSAILTGAQVSTLNGYLLPASAITYGATYPKIVITLATGTTFTILCAITSMQATDMGFGNWSVSLTFEERSS